jgi:hypothetical protein
MFTPLYRRVWNAKLATVHMITSSKQVDSEKKKYNNLEKTSGGVYMAQIR